MSGVGSEEADGEARAKAEVRNQKEEGRMSGRKSVESVESVDGAVRTLAFLASLAVGQERDRVSGESVESVEGMGSWGSRVLGFQPESSEPSAESA